MVWLNRETQKTLNDVWVIANCQLINLLCMSSSSVFQLKAHPFFFVTCFKSVFAKRLTSVGKLSPEKVFWIEFVSLSISKSSAIFLCFFTPQFTKK